MRMYAKVRSRNQIASLLERYDVTNSIISSIMELKNAFAQAIHSISTSYSCRSVCGCECELHSTHSNGCHTRTHNSHAVIISSLFHSSFTAHTHILTTRNTTEYDEEHGTVNTVAITLYSILARIAFVWWMKKLRLMSIAHKYYIIMLAMNFDILQHHRPNGIFL